ncbi:hypothetical protein QOZ89_45205 [Pseudofrankia sp. BMG5.37]|nr:hypothetical protein [Pseudofrankia sp. BMG5.37]MDT3446713.1 hypothetical protein [Pseudofrankia sp. BMG5.37]
MRDGGAEWPGRGAFRVDVDPLTVAVASANKSICSCVTVCQSL